MTIASILKAAGLAGFVVLTLAAGDPRPAGDLEAVMFASRDRVRADEEFELTIEVRGSDAGDAAAPDLFGLKDVRVLGDPSVSSRYQWADGRTTFTRSFRYTLMADRPGRIEIPPVTVRVGEREVATGGLALRVDAAAGPGRSPPAGTPAGSGEEPLVRALAEVDKSEVYLGEQVIIRFRVLTPREIRGLELLEQPEFTGFWVEEIPQDSDRDIRRVRRDGSSFIEYTVMKRALFPSRTGDLSIDPVIFSVTIPRRRSDPFSSLFFESRQTLHRRTDRLSLRVKPLPDAGRPEDFRGAVGDFRLSVMADPAEIRLNEALTLRITVQGDGNLSTLEPPVVVTPPEVRLYDPKMTQSLNTGEDGVEGSKTWSYVLVPRLAGRQVIPPVQFAFFDPQQKAYRTVRSRPVAVRVKPADAAAGRGHGDPASEGRDIHSIETRRGPLRDRSKPLYRHPATFAALMIPAAGNAALFLIQRRRRRGRANRSLYRRRRAWSRARRKFAQAERATPVDGGRIYDTVAGILSGYLADKFDLPPAGLTSGRVRILLAGAGIPEHLSRELRACLDACDAGRFDRGGRPPDPALLLGRARRALERIEKRL